VLTIRNEQMEALRSAVEARFEKQVLAYLRRQFPGRCGALPDETLCDHVRKCIRRARGWGIMAERDICKYAVLGLVMGSDFDRARPWAAAILNQITERGVQWTLEELRSKASEAMIPAKKADSGNGNIE